MSTLGALAILAGLFVAFGLLNRGAAKPSCSGCEHAQDPAGCASCPSQSDLH